MLNRFWKVLTSLQLTITCLAALMALVFLCTLAQVQLGTLGAVEHYMRSWFVTYKPGVGNLTLPIFPGGALVGLVLTLNLVAALIKRIDLNWRKSGLWLVHGGLVVLVAGEFITGAFQVDTRMAIEEGQTVNFLESYRDMELAVIDSTDPGNDRIFSVPTRLLAKGGTIALPGSPLSLKAHRFLTNAELRMRQPNDPPSLANQGMGANVTAEERPPVSADNDMNQTTAFVEPVAGGRSYGIWLVSTALGAPQAFMHEGRSYRMVMRPLRTQLPYTLTLKKFSHDRYPGTDIPKNFSSLVRLSNPAKGESRDVLISMNLPLRYDGKAFYQASFGKGDTLSILQVVENPGWLLPYISCTLVTLGLLLHFALNLRRSTKPRSTGKEA